MRAVEKSKPTTAPRRVFTEDGCFFFKGTRSELKDFLKKNNPEIYEKAFIHTINGSTRDWFGAMSTEFIRIKLSKYGFNWEPVYITLILKEEEE